ncbi:LysR family transcriptional regulator [Micromonospora sp. NPDC000089]|uniref:LysR family transcriptional regulator n=1 Tax=unclassified Micromonospora TaxID=2617518 RepID=UPI003677C15C
MRHLRYFLTLTEEHSFTRAAKSLGIAQSALSTQIRRIERHLDVELIRRGGRRMELTAAGEELARQARVVLAAVRGAEEAVRAEAGLLLLRMACYRTAWWPHELARIVQERDRNLRVRAGTVDTDDAVRQLASGGFDLCVGADFPALPLAPPEPLRFRELIREPVWVALPAAHPYAQADHVPLTALASDDWLVQPTGSYLRRATEQLCQDAGFAPRVVACGDSWELSKLLEQGRGVTLCSPLASAGDGFVIRPGRPPTWRRIFVAWRSETVTPSTVDAVCAAVHELHARHAVQVPEYPRSDGEPGGH